MWWTYVISKGMFEPHVSWPRAWSFVFQSPVPSLDPLFTGGCSRLRHAHLRRTSRIRPTLTQHHARTGPSLSLTERVPPLCGYLPHHLVEPLLFGSVPHRPSPRHCLDASHSGRPSSQRTPVSRKRFVSTVSLSTPSGVSSSSLWLAGGRGGNRIRRIHGRELQQRVQLGLRGRTLCLSGDAPWWHGGRGPSTAARKHRHRP